jgi:hypothetical protein
MLVACDEQLANLTKIWKYIWPDIYSFFVSMYNVDIGYCRL